MIDFLHSFLSECLMYNQNNIPQMCSIYETNDAR